MKVLHTVESYHPAVGGMAEVVRRISELLVRYGHEVVVATSTHPDRTTRTLGGVGIVEFNVRGNLVRGIIGEKDRYESYLLNADYDIIVNFAAQQWATDLALPLLERINRPKIFVPTGFSGLHHRNYRDYFEQMKSWMKQYDMNVFLSDDYRDVNFAKANDIDKRVLIPNGASEEEFEAASGSDIRQQLNIPEDDFLVLHVGSHSGLKGHAAAIRSFSMARIRRATFMIVAQASGSCFERCLAREARFQRSFFRRWDHKRLLIRTLSRPETVAAFKAADAFLFPSNIECSPIVLFECLASKTPFLVSDVGNAKEIIDWSSTGILLKSWRDFRGHVHASLYDSARQLERLFNDAPLRERMAEQGHAVWKRRFTWEKIARQYEALYLSLQR